MQYPCGESKTITWCVLELLLYNCDILILLVGPHWKCRLSEGRVVLKQHNQPLKLQEQVVPLKVS